MPPRHLRADHQIIADGYADGLHHPRPARLRPSKHICQGVDSDDITDHDCPSVPGALVEGPRMGVSTEGEMDRVVHVAFFVHGALNGLSLETRIATLEHGSASIDVYDNLSVPELLCLVEATLDLVQPGDGWIRGCVQPQLF